MNKAEIKPMVLDLPEGQRKKYPAKSAGYCLRQSNERSERAAIKNIQIKNCFYQLHRFKPTKLEKSQIL
ncbi:MAG: hypothetical protein PVI69_15220 [Desulfobacterales bacterium]|jgi:hypothetical protein